MNVVLLLDQKKAVAVPANAHTLGGEGLIWWYILSRFPQVDCRRLRAALKQPALDGSSERTRKSAHTCDSKDD